MILIQLFNQNVAEGPGSGTTSNHLIEIIIMLAGAFILGYVFRWVISAKYKKMNAVMKQELNAEIEINKKNFEHQKRMASLETKISLLEQKNSALRIQLSSTEVPDSRLIVLQEQNTILQRAVNDLNNKIDNQNSATTAPTAVHVAPTSMASSPAPKPIKIDSTDLKKIEGIGPRIQEILNENGIRTFSELATHSAAQLQEILLKEGPQYKVHDPGTWPKQAALAQLGKWDELFQLQAELKGGKKA